MFRSIYTVGGAGPVSYRMDFLPRAISSLEVAILPYAQKLLSLTFGFLAATNILSGSYPQESSLPNGFEVDYIIVGAGSAGCVLANRLTEIPDVTVLLIEAGDDPRVDALIPSLFPFIAYSEAEWNYFSVNDGNTSQAHKSKSQHYAIGKMLGGTSGSNYMIYVRGNKKDYNWMPGWDWETVLHYFKKSEGMTSKAILKGPTRHLHCTKGPLGVSRPNWGEKTMKYFTAFKQNGHRIKVDNNDINQLGYSQASFTIREPFRQNTALVFLKPIKNRKNLYILKNSYVRKVLFDRKKRAVGVEVRVHGKKVMYFRANKEVILSAGAINSAQILMNSGIGPKEHLKEKGVKVVSDSPNVGQNLQDHAAAIVTLTGEENILSVVENLNAVTNLDKFPTPLILGYASLNKSDYDAVPDYQVIGFSFPAGTLNPTLISSAIFRYEDYISQRIAEAGQTKETFFALVNLLHPKSKGKVRLKSSDPEDEPEITTGFYNDHRDVETHARCMEDFVSVINTPFFRKLKSKIVDFKLKQCRGLRFASREYWKCHVRHLAQTLWHLTGTCAMGVKGKGVVDERLRVWGVTGLRVVDGGVIPRVPSGNTNAPIIMLAERASDLIKEDNGLPVDKYFDCK